MPASEASDPIWSSSPWVITTASRRYTPCRASASRSRLSWLPVSMRRPSPGSAPGTRRPAPSSDDDLVAREARGDAFLGAELGTAVLIDTGNQDRMLREALHGMERTASTRW